MRVSAVRVANLRCAWNAPCLIVTCGCACGESQVRVWRISDGSVLSALTGHKGAVRSLAFHPHVAGVLASGEGNLTWGRFVLQCVAVCCRDVLQCVAGVCCSNLTWGRFVLLASGEGNLMWRMYVLEVFAGMC